MLKTKFKTELSVVVPVYGCAGCLLELQNKLEKILPNLTPNYEIVYIEDRGPDGSWEVLCHIAKRNKKVKAYRLSRNFGQQVAITAGLSKATGQWTIVMDCDLQDPPEEIPRLYKKAKEGFDIVLMKRKQKKFSLFRRALSVIYFKLLGFFTSEKLDGKFYGSFSIMHQKVRSAFLELNDIDRHYLFIIIWLGFRTHSLEYDHHERFAGKSAYDFKRLLLHALNGVFFQTTVLLRWNIYLGFWISLCGWISAFYFLYLYFFRSVPPGWTSLAVLLLIIGGFILISIGITGLYIGRIFDQVKSRPLFVVDQAIVHGSEE